MGGLKRSLAFASMAVVAICSGLLTGCGSDSSPATPTTTFMYTSDAHYGIKKAAFSGMSSAQQFNGAMIDEMNRLQTAKVALPADTGVNAGQSLSFVDFVVETGDAINRPDGTTTPFANANAAVTWPQFQADYFTRLNLLTSSNTKAPLWMTPGNHDVSAAIGYYKAPLPDAGLDATSYTAIYNLMMKPATALTNASFSTSATAAAAYASNRVVTSRDVNGVHFVFVGMWPDSVSRPLIDADLAKVSATTPVILFTHDQPTSESKHFTNPNAVVAPLLPINGTNKYENLLSDVYADTQAAGNTPGLTTDSEQRLFVAWLKTHKNIVAYFHGNDNANEFYTYTGPDNDIRLNIFRVDSPMKGNFSVADPTKLSFQVVSIDNAAKSMTVREYRWTTKSWGNTITVSLAPRAI